MPGLHRRFDSAPLHLSVFGEFSCRMEAPVHFPARSAAQLVAYIALHQDRWVKRNEVGEAIWPGFEDGSVKANVRKAIQRAKEALAPYDGLLSRGNEIMLNPEMFWTDLDHASDLHRQFNFAPHLPESIDLLHKEWLLVSQPLLEGWEDEWVQQQRVVSSQRAHDLGQRLAQAYESTGRKEEALEILEKILDSSPQDFDLLDQAVRWKYQLYGAAEASQLIDRVLEQIPSSAQVPPTIQRLIQRVRSGEFESIPASEMFDTRNQLVMLARMVQSNLQSGSQEAMAMLAKESSNIANWSHPQTLLAILTVALENSEVKTPDQIAVATNASFLGSYASDFQAGIWAGNRVLEALHESHPRYIQVLSILGFLSLETHNFEEARELIQRALDLCETYSVYIETPRVLSRLGVVEYHSGNFELARHMFHRAIELELENKARNYQALLAGYHGNLCSMEAMVGDWEAAKHHGLETLRLATESDAQVYRTSTIAPLGLAELMLGESAGLDHVVEGLRNTAKERMRRFNMMAIDYGVIALAKLGHLAAANQIARVNTVVRMAGGYRRGPAEVELMHDYLKGNSAVPRMTQTSLTRWLVEELLTTRSAPDIERPH